MAHTGGHARPITLHGTEVLHRPCQPVTVFDESLDALIDDMFASMYAAEGVGLAANQIGVDARVFVYDCRDASGENQIGHVVNPVLTLPVLAVEVDDYDEGCLSVPGPRARLPRLSLATVTGVDKTGSPVTVSGTGLLARCLQHETDHLNGIVYVDRLSADERRRVLAEAGIADSAQSA